MTVKRKNPNWLKELKRRYQRSGGEVVALGWPVGTEAVSNTYPDGTPVLNVAFWNQYGTRITPARDFMGPGGMAAIEETAGLREDLAQAINAGESTSAILEAMGLAGVAALKLTIRNISEPPNSPLTIIIKGSANPLIDTGAMVQSVTHVVRPG